MNKAKPTLNRTADGQLACAFGEPWMGEHPLCDAYHPGPESGAGLRPQDRQPRGANGLPQLTASTLGRLL